MDGGLKKSPTEKNDEILRMRDRKAHAMKEFEKAQGNHDASDDDEIVKPASELPECWQPMNVASTDGPLRLWESMTDEVRSAAASAGCKRLSLFVALSTLAAFALVITSAPREPPRTRSDLFCSDDPPHPTT